MIIRAGSFLHFIILLFSGTFFINVSYSQTPADYRQEMEIFYQKRMHALKAPNGWVNLAGLFWLKPGKNYFGSDTTIELVYKGADMPVNAGYFEYKDNRVSWHTKKGVKVRSQNEPVKHLVVYHPDSTKSPLMSLGSLRWNIIKRDDKLGVRLRDLNHPELQKLTSIDRFNLDTAWRLPAKFETSPEKNIFITNMIGQTHAQKSPGKLHFKIGETSYTLDVLESSGDELFVIFGDLTSGEESYASGRYIYVGKPDENNNTVIDFNKAINPPCVFTDFATCPLPPPQNILPVAVRAGEKKYGTR